MTFQQTTHQIASLGADSPRTQDGVCEAGWVLHRNTCTHQQGRAKGGKQGNHHRGHDKKDNSDTAEAKRDREGTQQPPTGRVELEHSTLVPPGEHTQTTPVSQSTPAQEPPMNPMQPTHPPTGHS